MLLNRQSRTSSLPLAYDSDHHPLHRIIPRFFRLFESNNLCYHFLVTGEQEDRNMRETIRRDAYAPLFSGLAAIAHDRVPTRMICIISLPHGRAYLVCRERNTMLTCPFCDQPLQTKALQGWMCQCGEHIPFGLENDDEENCANCSIMNCPRRK
jgi:hypothetical protein